MDKKRQSNIIILGIVTIIDFIRQAIEKRKQ